MEYTIGQVAQKLGITVDTLRYYDRQGLLPFVKRDVAGRRRFTDNDLHLMRTIICLKNAGVSVKDIGIFIKLRMDGDATLGQRSEILKHHKKHLVDEINILNETLSYLKFKEWYYDTAQKAGTEAIHLKAGSNMVRENLAEEYSQYLMDKGKLTELENFKEVRDYRNREL